MALRSAALLAVVLSVGAAVTPPLCAQSSADVFPAQTTPPPNQSSDPAAEGPASQTLDQSMDRPPSGAPAVAPKDPSSKNTNVVHKWALPEPRFETWPSPPAPTSPGPPYYSAPRPAVETSPLDPTRGKKLYAFRAEKLDLKLALALFARANALNIVPDQEVTGEVTLEVQDLPLDQIMCALLEAYDFTWTDKGGLIRVRAEETRTFSINYLRLSRKGLGISSATLSSGNSGGGNSGGGNSGGGNSGGGGGMGGGSGSGGGGGTGGGGSIGGSAINLTADNAVDFWKEIKEELAKVLTAKGKETLAINMTAGIIQVTDRPSALKRMQTYIDQIGTTVLRQVDIEAKLFDVTLNDQFQFGIDWVKLGYAAGGTFLAAGTPYALTPGGTPIVTPGGEFFSQPPALTMTFGNDDTKAALVALQQQGDVSVISQPRLRTLNNQTALIKVGTDMPFFSRNVYVPQYNYGGIGGGTAVGTTDTIVQDTYQLITIGTILALTPQIGEDGFVTMDISPVITNLRDTVKSQDGNTTAPELDIKQASSMVRVRSGDTIIMGGLIQNTSAKAVRSIPLLGDIPILGVLFQGRSNAKQKKELVIFLTPTIVR